MRKTSITIEIAPEVKAGGKKLCEMNCGDCAMAVNRADTREAVFGPRVMSEVRRVLDRAEELGGFSIDRLNISMLAGVLAVAHPFTAGTKIGHVSFSLPNSQHRIDDPKERISAWLGNLKNKPEVALAMPPNPGSSVPHENLVWMSSQVAEAIADGKLNVRREGVTLSMNANRVLPSLWADLVQLYGRQYRDLLDKVSKYVDANTEFKFIGSSAPEDMSGNGMHAQSQWYFHEKPNDDPDEEPDEFNIGALLRMIPSNARPEPVPEKQDEMTFFFLGDRVWVNHNTLLKPRRSELLTPDECMRLLDEVAAKPTSIRA